MITLDAYERLPYDQVRNTDLVDGELVDVPDRTAGHNMLRDRLLLTLWPHAEAVGVLICEQGFAFEGNVHGPDIALVHV